MKRLIAACFCTAVLLVPTAALADTCEVDGEDGFTMADGVCMTPSLYDETFSAENLATVPWHSDNSMSVADLYDLGTEKASERPRSFMGEELPTFAASVEIWHRVDNGWIIE